MLRAGLCIARYTLLEALRNRLLWLFGGAALGALGLSSFLHALALTESAQLETAVLAALLRLVSTFLIAAFVITSMVRESADKGAELLLALPVPRAAYLLGKLAGFGALAVLPALLFGVLATYYAPPAQAALWAASLLCELWIVAAFSLLCSLTMQQTLPALAAAGAFYLLARAIATFQLLGQKATATPLQRALDSGVDAIALLLPHLDRFTRSDWLVYHNGSAAELGAIALQSAIYIGLLAATATVDIYRKNI